MSFWDRLFGRKRKRLLGIKDCRDCYFFSEEKGYYGVCKQSGAKLVANLGPICGYWGEDGFPSTETMRAEGYTKEEEVLRAEDNSEVSNLEYGWQLKKTLVVDAVAASKPITKIYYEVKCEELGYHKIRIRIEPYGESETIELDEYIDTLSYVLKSVDLSKEYIGSQVTINVDLSRTGGDAGKKGFNRKFIVRGYTESEIVYE